MLVTIAEKINYSLSLQKRIRFAFLFPILFYSHFISFSQQTSAALNTSIDSLQSFLKTAKEDTIKLNTLYKLSEECADADILKYAEASLTLAEKLSASSINAIANAGKKGIANASANIGFVYANKGNISKALELFQRSLSIHEEMKNKKGISNLLNNIAVIYKTQGDLKVAFCCISSRLRRIGPLAGRYNGCDRNDPLDKQRRVHDNR